MKKASFMLSLLLITLASLICWNVFAQIYVELDDKFDSNNKELQGAVSRDLRVKSLAHEVEKFKRRLRLLKERDFIALFGKKVLMSPNAFALPCYESRLIAFSGVRYADPKKNKNHTDFYSVGDFGGLQVYYGIDGVTPVAIVFYFPVNQDFPRLNSLHDLDKRLVWDQAHFQKLVLFFEERRRGVFKREVDPVAEKRWAAGDYARNAKAKLAAWAASGKKLGYRLKIRPEVNAPLASGGTPPRTGEEAKHWEWFRQDGTKARSVYTVGSDPLQFIWYHDDGVTPRREEDIGEFFTPSWRWSRKDGTMIRYETADTDSGRWQPAYWMWCDVKGHSIRHEVDDNADGIPDWVGVSQTKKSLQPLAIENSWAIHPTLIPEASRIPDQRDRHVPIREIKDNP